MKEHIFVLRRTYGFALSSLSELQVLTAQLIPVYIRQETLRRCPRRRPALICFQRRRACSAGHKLRRTVPTAQLYTDGQSVSRRRVVARRPRSVQLSGVPSGR